MRDRCAWISKKVEHETGFAKERGQIKVKQIESYGIKIKSLKLKKYCIIQRFLKCCYRTPNQTPTCQTSASKHRTRTKPLSKPDSHHHLWQRAGVLWTPDYCPNALCQSYFAHPYPSWKRGLNENTDGLIRKYLPKSRPLTNVTQKELNYIMDQLNHRPRKTLGFRTPYEVFFKKKTLLTVALTSWIRSS